MPITAVAPGASISLLAASIRSSVRILSRWTGPMAVITATSGGIHEHISAISPGP